jgi:hypothetical protein
MPIPNATEVVEMATVPEGRGCPEAPEMIIPMISSNKTEARLRRNRYCIMFSFA